MSGRLLLGGVEVAERVLELALVERLEASLHRGGVDLERTDGPGRTGQQEQRRARQPRRAPATPAGADEHSHHQWRKNRHEN